MDHGEEPPECSVRSPSMAWMTDELIQETHRVWSPAYGRVISVDEAVEILRNVKRFAEVLLNARLERENE